MTERSQRAMTESGNARRLGRADQMMERRKIGPRTGQEAKSRAARHRQRRPMASYVLEPPGRAVSTRASNAVLKAHGMTSGARR